MKNLRIKIAVITVSIVFAVLQWLVPPLFIQKVSVSMELKTWNDEVCQIFYGTRINSFADNQPVTMQYSSRGDFIKIYIPVTNRMKINNLRIDPVTNSKEFHIKNIILYVGKNEIVYSGEEIIKHFELVNLEAAGITDGIITMNQINSPDSQLILKPAINEIFEIEKTNAKFIFFVASTVLYLMLVALIILFGRKIYSTLNRWRQSLDYGAAKAINSDMIFSYLQKNKIIIIFSFLVAIFTYGYELFNFSLSIDEEIDSFRTASEAYAYIFVGRWGLYFLKLFFQPTSLIPYYPTIIALICLSASAAIFVIRNPGKFSSGMIFSILYISNPIHSYYLTFNTSGMYFTMGLMLTTIAYFIFKHTIENRNSYLRNYFFTILLLGFSISLYQSHLVFFLVFVTYFIFIESLSPEGLQWKFLRRIILGLLVVISLSLIFYKIGDLITRFYFLPANLNTSAYLDNFSKWNELPSKQVLSNLYLETKDFLTGTGPSCGILGLSLKSIPIIILLILINVFSLKRPVLKNTISVIVFFALILSPFLLMFYTGAKLPMRAMIPMTLMIALLWLTEYRQAGAFLRRLMFLFALLILINNTWINTRFFYATYTSWQADRDIATRIIERIYQLDPHKNQGEIKVAFSGNYAHQQNELFFKSETHGASFFEWNPGEPYRISPFFKTTGVNEIKTVSLNLLKDYKSEIEVMPSWPDYGSVKLFDDIVVVKFSEPKIPRSGNN
jgi:hypothetical protein